MFDSVVYWRPWLKPQGTQGTYCLTGGWLRLCSSSLKSPGTKQAMFWCQGLLKFGEIYSEKGTPMHPMSPFHELLFMSSPVSPSQHLPPATFLKGDTDLETQIYWRSSRNTSIRLPQNTFHQFSFQKSWSFTLFCIVSFCPPEITEQFVLISVYHEISKLMWTCFQPINVTLSV